MTQGQARRDGEDPAVRSLGSDLRRLRDRFNRTVLVEWLRFRTQAGDAFLRSAFYLCFFVFCLVGCLAAAAFLAYGIRDALGNLGAGLAILALLIGAGLALRFHLWNKGIRRTRRVLADRGPREP
ncbi:MAG TPA: hypothetical protein VJU16_00140 [Planctomycetota bacterium]|nr:hypothetical protein [Planctomycetota bacterium]